MDLDGDELTVEALASADGALATMTAPSAEPLHIPIETLSGGEQVLRVVADDGRAIGSRDVQVTVNGAPSAPVVAVSPENPSEHDDVVATIVQDAVDPEGEALEYSWVWSKEGSTEGCARQHASRVADRAG